MELKRTSLFSRYRDLGAKTTEFGGWEMPVQFAGILAEHEAVRRSAGLFDVSHMGEFEVVGRGAADFLQGLLTNDVRHLNPGGVMYTPMTNDAGGCVDDLLVYCYDETHYMMVVNAANTEKDIMWVRAHAEGRRDVAIHDISEETALIALQGPLSAQVVNRLTHVDLTALAYYHFVETKLHSIPVTLSRTGYTGEDGFEVYLDAHQAVPLWDRLLEEGRDLRLLPCGLGARDTLRLEACLPLYGHELDEDITPLEAGLGRFVKLDKGDFPGREALVKQAQDGVLRTLIRLRAKGQGIPRSGYSVYKDGQPIGVVTSGTLSPTSRTGIAMALVDRAAVLSGGDFTVDIRGKQAPFERIKSAFYKRNE